MKIVLCLYSNIHENKSVVFVFFLSGAYFRRYIHHTISSYLFSWNISSFLLFSPVRLLSFASFFFSSFSLFSVFRFPLEKIYLFDLAYALNYLFALRESECLIT